MTYLLDVNALIALAFIPHAFHERVAMWATSADVPQLATCSITELGFVRILSQPMFGLSVKGAQALLVSLTGSSILTCRFIADDQDITHLPAWVKTSKQTTDGHLVALAKRHRAMLATLDGKIVGSYLIP